MESTPGLPCEACKRSANAWSLPGAAVVAPTRPTHSAAHTTSNPAVPAHSHSPDGGPLKHLRPFVAACKLAGYHRPRQQCGHCQESLRGAAKYERRGKHQEQVQEAGRHKVTAAAGHTMKMAHTGASAHVASAWNAGSAAQRSVRRPQQTAGRQLACLSEGPDTCYTHTYTHGSPLLSGSRQALPGLFVQKPTSAAAWAAPSRCGPGL